jgi:hypothetical protein
LGLIRQGIFDAVKIISGDLRIIGPTAGNNPNLHHGVAYLYYLALPILFLERVLWELQYLIALLIH